MLLTDQLREVCIDAATIGGDLAQEHFNDTDLKVQQKQDHSLVSQIDKLVEVSIIRNIKKRFPDHGIHGEETGQSKSDAEYVWHIDPIDGTSNYIAGVPLYCTIVGVAQKDEGIVTTVYLPITQQVITAQINKGLSVNGKSQFIQSVPESSDQLDLIVEWSSSPQSKKETYTFLYRHGLQFRTFRRVGTYASLAHYLANGRPLCMIHFNEFDIYESIPVQLLASQAGLAVVGETGGAWSPANKAMIICPKGLEVKITSLVQDVL